MLTLDAKTGVITAANQHALDVSGHKPPELIGKRLRDVWDLPSVLLDELLDAARAGTFIEKTAAITDAGDRQRWLRFNCGPIKDEKGVGGVLVTGYDITADRKLLAELRGRNAAVERTQATIEFDLFGTILNANENFLNLTGYALGDVVGQPHRMFVDEQYAASEAYERLWEQLRNGNPVDGEFKRLGKGGREIWIRATYNPIFDLEGRPYKVVRFAFDITDTKLKNAEYEGKVDALGRAQAIIEFDLAGKVVAVNRNFLETMGYTPEEVMNKHHRMFVDDQYGASKAY